MFMFIELAV